MSLNRLIARLAVVHAFNNYMQEPWPTLAGPNIFDSKIEPVEEMKFDKVFPCVVVYTDYDKDHWNKARAAHQDRLMSITLELLIVQSAQGDTPDTFKLNCPFTDSEIEMSLDILEVQIFRALSAGTEASDAFNYLCPGVQAVISRRGASVEGGERLAARQITLEMKALRDNVAGVIPPEVNAFLTKLEAHPDYADRIDDLRAIMTAPASDSAFQRAMNTFGYTRSLTSLLGGSPAADAVLPPSIAYHFNEPPP